MPWRSSGRSSPALVVVVLVVVLTLLAGACDSGGSTSRGASSTTTRAAVADRGNVDGTLVLGQLAPLTGSLAPLGRSYVTPVQMAVDEANLSGGVGARPVKVVVADDATDDTTVATASLRSLLDTDKADAILGPASSGTALALMKDVRDQNVIQCAGSNTRAELSTADSGGRYFRTSPSDALQGPALAQLVARQGRKRPVVLVRNDSYGAQLAATLLPALRRAGVMPAGGVVTYAPSGSDAKAAVARALARKPDSVILLGLTDDGAKVVAALVAAGAGPAQLPLDTVDGLQGSGFAAAVDPAHPATVAGITGTAPAAAPAGIDSPFLPAFAATGVDPVFSAYAYDCAMLVMLAAVRAGTDDPARLRTAFAANLRGSTDCGTFATCKAALAAGTSIHYRGASSRFDHWRGTEPGTGTYEVWSYDPTGRVVTAPASQQIEVGG